MKQLLAASTLAILLLASTHQSASAWCSMKFGIGLNVEFACGNNSCCWGMFSNGQVPCPYGPPMGYCPPGYGGFGYGQAPAPAGEFYAPQPTPLNAYAPPSSAAPSQYAYPASYSYPVSYSYPASYQPMSYPAAYYPMSYSPTYYGR